MSVERIDKLIYPGSENYTAAERAAPGSVKVELDGESIIKADDIAYILFTKPNLDLQQNFLEDFGLKVAQRSDDALYMKGFGPSPYFYVAQKANESRFLGTGYAVKTRGELETLSRETGLPIEAVDGPGGGQRVRLTDPSGYIVDVVYGRREVTEQETRRQPLPINTPWEKGRVNQGQRTPTEPAPVQRLGHCVMMSKDFMTSAKWYMKHLGVFPSDVQCTADGTPVLAFMRLNRGSELADHHTVVVMQGPEEKYLHSAYETLDVDSIGQGQQFLKWKGWTHFWGIGRHILGSQIFDYWLDPYGDEVEHYADGDMFDENYPTQYHLLDRGGLWQWGDDVPDAIRPKLTLKDLMSLLGGWLTKSIDFTTLGKIKTILDRPPRPWLK